MITAASKTRRILQVRAQGGFTLIELVVTMIVVGILAVVVVPRLSLLRGYDEVGYRDKVKATLEYARKTAVAQRRIACVTVTAEPTKGVTSITLTIDNVIPENPAAGGCLGILALPAADSKYCDSTPPPQNRVCAPSASIALTGPDIRFDALGRPLNSSGSPLTTYVEYPIVGVSPNIRVEAETGYVH